MFRFEKEQSVWDFNGTKIGGQPGEYPTVLGASIFYNKHEVVLDDKTGKIDKAKAEALWNRCQVLSDLTGIPHFIQIIAEYGEAFESDISWFDSDRQQDRVPDGLVGTKGTCPRVQVRD